MSGLPKAHSPLPACPFCGVANNVPHETQEGCIAALNTEIGRMRGLLANLKPAGVPRMADETEDHQPAAVRLALD